MIRKLAVSTILSIVFFSAFAQEEMTEKRSNHYIGIQANQLLRQILNFGGSNTTVSNPYLLTYQVNSNRTGWGFNLGLGYVFDEFKDGDPTNNRETNINDLFIRVGFEKKSTLGKKWLVSWGFDASLDAQSNETVNTVNNQFSKAKIETNNSNDGWGFGPRFSLGYQVSEKIFLGTEATYYFKSFKEKSGITSAITSRQFNPNTGQQQEVTNVTKEETDEEFKSFQLKVPVVLLLVVKF